MLMLRSYWFLGDWLNISDGERVSVLPPRLAPAVFPLDRAQQLLDIVDLISSAFSLREATHLLLGFFLLSGCYCALVSLIPELLLRREFRSERLKPGVLLLLDFPE